MQCNKLVREIGKKTRKSKLKNQQNADNILLYVGTKITE